MRIALGECPGILLVRGFDHVAEKQGVDAVVAVSARLVEGHHDQSPLTQLWRESIVEKLLHPRAGDLYARIVAVMVHVGGVQGVGDESPLRVFDEKVIGLAGVHANHPVAPLLLHLAKAKERNVTPRIIAGFARDSLGRVAPWTGLTCPWSYSSQ